MSPRRIGRLLVAWWDTPPLGTLNWPTNVMGLGLSLALTAVFLAAVLTGHTVVGGVGLAASVALVVVVMRSVVALVRRKGR